MTDVILHAPAFTPGEASELARRIYGLHGTASALTSERDQNFLVETAAGDRFVLKIANGTDELALLEAQNAALQHVARTIRLCPHVLRARDGAFVADIQTRSGGRHYLRLVTWIAGVPLGTIADQPADLLHDVGARVAELDAALDGFDHPALHRDFYWDLVKAPALVEELSPLVADPAMRALVAELADDVTRRDARRLAGLRQAVVHNDPNDFNILVEDTPRDRSSRKVTGILDFGDIVHSYAVADLAIAAAYAMLGKSDPLDAAISVVRGYQTIRPLTDDEIEALPGLITLRLCASVCIAAHQQAQRPGDDYLSVSQQPIAETLPAFAAIEPQIAASAFRRARGRTAQETLAARRRVIGGNLSIAYRRPVKIVRGWMQYIYDDTGRQYLDAYNNVPHVGHCHPRVVDTAVEQMRVLNTNTRYLHDTLPAFAERLTATLPEPLRVCYFVNSGSEANELALRLARAHTGQRDVIVLDGAYHGNTTTLVEISPYKFNGPGGAAAPRWVHVVPLPDTYRGQIKRRDPEAGAKYARFVADAIEEMTARRAKPSAFIAESAPSVGGQIILPDGYLAAVYSAVHEAGGLCIADEVQTAYGRMGTHFYAFEAQRVVPDIVVLGKPIGNGYPLGAVVTTPEIARSFDNGMEFFSTFGGSTVSCAVGLSVLDVVQEERLQDHAREVGDALLDKLRALAARHPIVGDVRGSGLFVGVELVNDPVLLEPATEEAVTIANQMRERGILLGTEGPFNNVLKIRPPMPFTRADADVLVTTLDEVLSDAVDRRSGA
jgi:4-aminobutyrate aminotransferase-like enzyme/Ser/Thr protein kinase RdoA (MazF antagonist)